ncbi:putative membrane protein [Treponema primitia ZAS-2]|uniref:Putative membrane protein n=1 Tax=Treponema primitia (strain ATCC BAA-887 / DSM 12427 / ZAS-2) TaxID=545694 RepID=F5YGR6_TREPZ|nr:YitT family protein [Treponema primitia]AEF85771.1 putative membrane protein [Treponema primitia ZAS-2]
MITGSSAVYTVKRVSLLLLGSFLMAFNINTFVHAGGLLPGGFTGLTILFQQIALRYGNIQLPFSIIYFVLNSIPAAICFKYIGKKFTLYSLLVIVVSGVLTDWMPSMFIDFLQLHDILLSAVFGGILNAVGISLCLYADATSGGTDFIAIFISEKYHKESWNFIFAGNCVILAVAAYLFSLDKALYSVIFQFTTTMGLSSLYHGYQQKTLLIITNKPDEVYTVIKEKTNHAATSFKGFGYFDKAERTLLYSVVSAHETAALVTAIEKIDPGVFINVIRTEQLNGRFYTRPRD